MSTHEVLVVKVESVENHNNADALEILKVSGYDYTIVSKKGQFQVGELGIFVEPDYVIPTTIPLFNSLYDGKRDKLRVTAKRLRGIWSEGLLVKALEHHKLGDNVMDEFNITRWEPPPSSGFKNGWGSEGADLKSGICAKAPKIPDMEIPIYAVENYKKFGFRIPEGSPVFYSVKIHGANARFVFWEGKMHCGSRTTWKLEPGSVVEYTNSKTGEVVSKTAADSSWWEALKQNPWIEDWCRANPGSVVFGEVYGPSVQGNKFHYGLKPNELGVRVFDVYEKNGWVPFQDLLVDRRFDGLKRVPVLFAGPHDKTKLAELVEQPETSLDNCGENHIREGIVVRSISGETLKYVSNNYLTRS